MSKSERTPNKTATRSEFETRDGKDKEKEASLHNWLQSGRQTSKKKLNPDDSDSDSSISHASRRHRIMCCASSDTVNESINAFKEEMKTMHNLLTAIKEEQNARFSSIQKNVCEIKTQVLEMKKSSEELEQSVDYLGSKLEKLDQFRQENVEFTKKQENRLKDLMQRNTYLEKCNRALEERVGLIEQKELELNIELINVQKQDGFSTLEQVQKIAKELSLDIEDIEKAWRVGDESKESRPIVVKLKTQTARTKWLKCRKIPINNLGIFGSNNSTRIYINEHLTRTTRQLFWMAKNNLRDIYKYIWIQRGKILIKKDEKEKKIYEIRTENDIQNMKENGKKK